ncbi:MAG TPA: hypothetical protein VJS47_01205 [Rhizomicrobium sp.]|nr:hypothetical protein [Rhizomicrobium sp.]
MLSLAVLPAHSQIMGVDVQVSNGKRIPTEEQIEAILPPGSFVRDMLGWHRVDRYCDLVSNPSRGIEIPDALATLHERVAAAGMKNFVTLGFNNRHCGQAVNSGTKLFPNTPALRAEFAAYAVEVVRRVPALGGISIWNELNGTWNGGYTSQSQQLMDYCLLSNAVVTEIRKIDKSIPIAIGATVGAHIDDWFIAMFDKYGCIGKGDPTIWLDVHPYLSGKAVPETGKLDWQLWRSAIANIREAGISNPLAATEWGARAAHRWTWTHPAGNYMTTFQAQVLSRDPNWAAAFWFEMLYDPKAPNAGLFDRDGLVTKFGTQFIEVFRN